MNLSNFINHNKSRRIIIEYDYCWRVSLIWESGKIVLLEYPYHNNFDEKWSAERDTYFVTTQIDESNLPGLDKTLEKALEIWEENYDKQKTI